jgi:hypothetical protein
VSNRLIDYQDGRLPRREDVAAWRTTQTYLFLQYSPRILPVDDCRALDAAFALDRTRGPQFQSQVLEIAVRSGYRESLPRAQAQVDNWQNPPYDFTNPVLWDIGSMIYTLAAYDLGYPTYPRPSWGWALRTTGGGG